MSCNRGVTECAALAEANGLPGVALEANWAKARNGKSMRLCGVCRNSFLRADGGCTKCEHGLAQQADKNPARFVDGFAAGKYPQWAMAALAPAMARAGTPQVQQIAVPYLADRQILDSLARSADVGVRAGVAGNCNTSPETLAVLIESKNLAVYRAAAYNPSLNYEALATQAERARQEWERIAEMLSMQMLRYMMMSGIRSSRGGGVSALLMPMILLGIHGKAAHEAFQRHSALQKAVIQRENEGYAAGIGVNSSAENGKSPAYSSGQVATLAPPLASTPDSRLTNEEWQLFKGELEIAESGLNASEGYYEDRITLEDVVRLQEQGIRTDADAEIAGYLLGQMRRTARHFEGWYGDDVTEETFGTMQEKLRCSNCRRYAAAGIVHRCGYPEKLGGLEGKSRAEEQKLAKGAKEVMKIYAPLNRDVSGADANAMREKAGSVLGTALTLEDVAVLALAEDEE